MTAILEIDDLSSSLASGRALTAARRRVPGSALGCGPTKASADPTDGTEKKIDIAVDLLRLLEIDGERFDGTAAI